MTAMCGQPSKLVMPVRFPPPVPLCVNNCLQSDSLITGRVGYVRPTSTNPAAANIAMVPV